jgi:hypothetical protein
VEFQVDKKGPVEYCPRIAIKFFLCAPAWKQFLDLMLPLLLLNVFLSALVWYPVDDPSK